MNPSLLRSDHGRPNKPRAANCRRSALFAFVRRGAAAVADAGRWPARSLC
jgi:hypothetical protein